MKEIVPHRLIIDLNSDGSFKNGILQYRIRSSGIMEQKFFTMGIAGGINLPAMNTMLLKTKEHVEIGEKIKSPVKQEEKL